MQLEEEDGLTLTHVEIGNVQGTYAQTFTLRLQLEGTTVALQLEHHRFDHTHGTRFQTRFPVQMQEGEACVGCAIIELYEAPSLAGIFLPVTQGLDAAFTQLFQTFLRVHRKRLIQIARDIHNECEHKSQYFSRSSGICMAA